MRPIRAVAVILAPVCAAGAVLHTACQKQGNTTTPPGEDAAADVVIEHVRIPYDGAVSHPGPPRVPVQAQVVSSRVEVQPLMFAAGEMQTSGEPFASQFAGRNLGSYDRYYLPTDEYLLHPPGSTSLFVAYTDVFGFSTAVESYEYSKYHMNMVLQQTAAGLSLAAGPLVMRRPEATAQDRLRGQVVDLLTNAGTAVGGFAVLPPPPNNPRNDLGFRGVWPVFAPYEDFDPTITPDLTIANSCTSVRGYGGLSQFGDNAVPIYECDYNSLHLGSHAIDGGVLWSLGDRTPQIDFTTGPGVLGFTTWKEALWAIDFTGRLHDSVANQVNAVSASDLPLVGTAGNTVQATDPPSCASSPPPCSAPGTAIGSTPLEGMWGMLMLAEMDNAAEWLVSSLSTTDGMTLSGFPTKALALAYDYSSPLQWFPTLVAVTEDSTTPYPLAASLVIKDATSHSVDLAALLRGEGLFFGMTDANNAQVGQQIGLQCSFDGEPFTAQVGPASGQETAHDRSLSIIRVALVDLDRMHADPTLGVVMDRATVSGGAVTRGSTVTTTSLGHVILGLRTALMGLNGAVTQYGAPNPDPALDPQGALSQLPFHPPGGAPNFSARLRQLLLANTAFVRDVLTHADGTVANTATVTGGVATTATDPATLESQTAAVRALVEGFLMTGDESYRTRARLVVQHLDAAFYSQPARMYRQTEGGPDQVHMGPERFAWLQSALRETYKSLYVPGDPVLGRDVLEDRIGRINKLFLDGWDDLNGDQNIQGPWQSAVPNECLAARLQPAEQILTGELGHDDNGFPKSGGPDHDQDCVHELAHAQIASCLSSDVLFHSP